MFSAAQVPSFGNVKKSDEPVFSYEGDFIKIGICLLSKLEHVASTNAQYQFLFWSDDQNGVVCVEREKLRMQRVRLINFH